MQGRLYPNGEFTASALHPNKLRIAPFHSGESTEEASWRSLVAAHVEMYGVRETIRIVQQVNGEDATQGVSDVLGGWEEEVGSLGLSNVPNSRQERFRSLRGRRGMSSYARRLVRNAAYGLENTHSKATLSFLTLTLPPMSGLEFKTFMKEYWAKCTKKFFDWLAKRLVRAGLPMHWVGCTEIQEKRFGETGIPYPHLHVVFVGRRSHQGWSIAPSEFRVEWVRILEATGVCAFAPGQSEQRSLENVQQVRKSVEAYLGKYLSKGSAMMANPAMQDWLPYLPSNWHFVSQRMKNWVKRNTVSGEDVGEFLLTLCEAGDQDWLQWVFPIDIPWGDVTLRAGYAGKLFRGKLRLAQEVLQRREASCP